MSSSGAPQRQDTVSSYLEALKLFVAVLDPGDDGLPDCLGKLSSCSMKWQITANIQQAPSASLAVDTCEALVKSLRIFRSSQSALLEQDDTHCEDSVDPQQPLALSPQHCGAFACSFLALAAVVRAFGDAVDLPVPGEFAVISGLESDSGRPLNGRRGFVERFHVESGRFIVKLDLDDPPSEWKKVRAQNLRPENLQPSDSARAVLAAQECGSACLEGISDIFDSLLQELQVAEDALEDTLFSHGPAQLATSMWEALICCISSGLSTINGAQFLELCESDLMLCARWTRCVLSTHGSLAIGLLVAPNTPEATSQIASSVRRLRLLQESIARSFSELLSASTFWTDFDEMEKTGVGGQIQEHQNDLDNHVLRVAAASCIQDLLPEWAAASQFHLTWAVGGFARMGESVQQCQASIVVLPLLFCQSLCSMLAASFRMQDSSALLMQRHIRLLIPEILTVILTFCHVLLAKQSDEDFPDLLAGLPSLLDAFVVLSSLSMWSGSHVDLAQEVVDALLGIPAVSAHISSVSRLILAMLSVPQHGPLVSIAQSIAQDPMAGQALARQLISRARLLFWAALPGEAQPETSRILRLAEDWIGVRLVGAASDEEIEAAAKSEVQTDKCAVDNLIGRCMADLPASLRADVPPAPPATTTATATSTGGLTGAPDPSPLTESPAPGSLSLLGMPPLPGQQQQQQAAAAEQRKKRHPTSRKDLAQLRGVDASKAPKELRCTIDGKLMGEPVRSPHGHLYEKETLSVWLQRCGSVCPITGMALREEDCTPDLEAQQQILEWVKGERRRHRDRQKQRQQQREEAAAGQPEHAGNLV